MTDLVEGLRRRNCAPGEGGVAPLTEQTIAPFPQAVQGRSLLDL